MNTQAISEILTVTLNPALDYATTVPRIVANRKLYCGPARVDPGGGGVNVARAVGRLGGKATALVVTGGATGTKLMTLLSTEPGVRTVPFEVAGETRFSFAATDDETGDQQRFSLPGEALTATERTNLLKAIKDATPRDGLVVLSGGIAPGLPDDFLKRIQSEIRSRSPRIVVDTSRAPLRSLIETPIAPLFLLRVDQKEAAQAAQHSMDTLADSLLFARTLVSRGVAHHVVTGRGAEGSILVTPDRAFLCHAPQVPVKSKIGAGDALVGAMVLALARHDPPEQALKWGVAAASATVGTEGTALCDLETVTALLHDCYIEAI